MSNTRLLTFLLPAMLALSACGGGSAGSPDVATPAVPDTGSGTPTTGDSATPGDDSTDNGGTPATGGETPTSPDSGDTPTTEDPGTGDTPDSGGESPTTPPDDGGNNQPDPDADTTPPSVKSTIPVDQASHVAASDNLAVTFNEAIDPASAPGAVRLVGPSGAVGVDLSISNATLTINPKSSLAEGAWTVTVDGGIADLAGNTLGSSYSWQFDVASGGLCENAYSSGFALVQGKDTTRESSFSRPAKGVPYKDPAYGSCVVRVTDHEKEGIPQQARNLYSRIQPFNADNSRVLVNSPSGYFYLYDPHTAKYIKQLSLGGGSVEPQWHPTNPDLLYVFPNHGGMTISEVNVETGAKRVVADFRNVKSINGYAGKTSIQQIWSTAARVWTHWEGSPSKDARYWGLMVETSGGSPLGMITYDLQQNVITGVFDYQRDGNGIDAPDHISMSPSGQYVVPSWNGSGENCPSMSELGTTARPCGLMSYTRDFSRGVGLTVRGPHSDIGIDASGRDVIVAGDYVSGWVEMWDLGTGAKTHLFQIYDSGNSTAMHISAKSFDKPGWVLVSTYSAKQAGWYVKKMFAVEMTANPRILNIAHTYNEVETYYSETHAAVNRDFTRIMFNSNWNTANMNNIDAYQVVLPKGAIPAAR